MNTYFILCTKQPNNNVFNLNEIISYLWKLVNTKQKYNKYNFVTINNVFVYISKIIILEIYLTNLKASFSWTWWEIFSISELY